MGVLKATCDGCGALLSGDAARPDYENQYFCRLCRLENEIREVTDELEKKKKWLEETHLKDVREMGTKLEGLANDLAALQMGSDWFGKGCEHQSCEWEDDERTGGPNYKECTPVLILCGHDDNPEDTEGNCRENICPGMPRGLGDGDYRFIEDVR